MIKPEEKVMIGQTTITIIKIRLIDFMKKVKVGGNGNEE